MKKMFIFLLFAGVLNAQKVDTFKVDVIELFKGVEQKGEPRYYSVADSYVYHFVNERNKMLFDSNKEKYQIQLGGACARMGPLSGLGSPSIFTIYKNKLYIFASQSCKSTFLRKGDDLLEEDDPIPTPSINEIEKGGGIIEKIINTMKGKEKTEEDISFELKYIKENEYKGENVFSGETYSFNFPNMFRQDSYWGNSKWSFIISDRKGLFEESSGRRPMVEAQVRAAKKTFSHKLLYLILRGKQNLVFAGNDSLVNSKKYFVINIYSEGTSYKLLVDENYRVYSQTFKGRGPGLFIGKMEKFYTDYKIYDGYLYPATETVKFNGEVIPEMTATLENLKVLK